MLVKFGLILKNLSPATKPQKVERFRPYLERMCDQGILHDIAVKHLEVLDSTLKYIESGDESHLKQGEAHYEEAAKLMDALSEEVLKHD